MSYVFIERGRDGFFLRLVTTHSARPFDQAVIKSEICRHAGSSLFSLMLHTVMCESKCEQTQVVVSFARASHSRESGNPLRQPLEMYCRRLDSRFRGNDRQIEEIRIPNDTSTQSQPWFAPAYFLCGVKPSRMAGFVTGGPCPNWEGARFAW